MATDNNFFTDVDWTKLQQQYVDAVSSFYSTPTQNAANPWQQAMEYWWQSVGGQVSDKNKPVFNSVMDQSRVFYSIAEQFASMLGDISQQSQGQNDWQDIVVSHMENMKSMFDQFQKNSHMPSLAPVMMWSSPMEMWNQVVSSALPGDSLNKLLDVPGIGLTGHLQEKTQKTIRLWNDYQLNNDEYNAAFAVLGKEALDMLAREIQARADSDNKITSLKEIYNMWVDANEEVFAEYAMTEEYAILYANLVNSLARFKKHYNEMMEDMLETMNLPTMQGVESIAKQQHVIKQELRDNRRDQAELQVAMDKLQSELAALKKSDVPAQKKKSSKKKAANKTSRAKPAPKKPSKKAVAKKQSARKSK